MSATFAPCRWPPAQASRGGGAWLFGQEVLIGGDGAGLPAVQWRLRRNCSITPAQLMGVYLSLCAVSLLIGLAFLWQGAPLVLAFAGLELLLFGLALVLFARHAGDHETLTLVGGLLQVDQHTGSRVARTEFAAEWLHVEPAAGQGSLVQLSARGQRVCVGRFLRPELRGAFARELRLALRRMPARDGAQTDSN